MNEINDKIRVMDELLSSKIAAGEVVERPASVVKELIENSIDAGATEVAVTVAEGGSRLIRVVDNGRGISPQDAPLTVVRHATSKIKRDNELSSIRTMGFRGEALSSIAAVSRLSLLTRTASVISGTLIRAEGSVEPEVSEAASAPGTTVEVRDLFFNTPARAKFMRTASTEFGRITEIFKKIALAHPKKRFKLIHGSSTVVDSAPGTPRERVADLFGRAVSTELVEIKKVELPGLTVGGFISRPELSYATARGLNIFINQRPIRDPGLSRALLNGYGTLLERGRYPFAVIFIDVSPEDVDVNVHPAKNEVRLQNHGQLFDTLRLAVNRTLAGAPSFSPDGPLNAGSAGEAPAPREYGAGTGTGLRPPGARPSLSAREARAPWTGGASAGTGAPMRLELSGNSEEITNPEFLDMEYIGQLWGEFLLCQSWREGGELYLIDQHAAAERARFERLKSDYYGKRVASQLLLIPERIETSIEEKEALLGAMSELTRLGFEIIPFGPSTKKTGETFLIKAAPEIFDGRSSGRLISDLAEELSVEGGSTRIEERIEALLMRIACHSVIRGQRALTKEEAASLLSECSKVDFAAHCPHGRPVVKRITRAEVEGFFNRS